MILPEKSATFGIMLKPERGGWWCVDEHIPASSGGTIMGVNQAPTAKGKEAAAGLKQAAKKEERKTEARKGGDLAKGAKRFEERSKSSDGRSAGDKQRD
jgi:hypothetical protein